MEKIDFVVTWVDGNDPAWQAEKAQYTPGSQGGSGASRFRDWDMMHFWFRAVEKFAPWVNCVYFVTWGHLPAWLNTDHPKLKVVNHRDYIPAQKLPTFNSNVLEIYMHRIPGLQEQFVLFNDDLFLTAPVEPEEFFLDGKPREYAQMDAISGGDYHDPFPHTLLNNVTVLNKYFSKKAFLKQNFRNLFRPGCGKAALIRNILTAPFPRFTGFRDPHICASYRKATFAEIWEKEGDLLDRVGDHRFRSPFDLTHYLMKCWQLCQGNYVFRPASWGKYLEMHPGLNLEQEILGGKHKIICLNDTEELDFEETKAELHRIFSKILPGKCSFEK